jgi:hypothetical protein
MSSVGCHWNRDTWRRRTGFPWGWLWWWRLILSFECCMLMVWSERRHELGVIESNDWALDKRSLITRLTSCFLSSTANSFRSSRTYWSARTLVFIFIGLEITFKRFSPSVRVCLPKLRPSNVSGIAPTIDAIFDCLSHLRVEEAVEKSNGESL